MRLLIVNGDLPVFPGRAGHEFLHTTRLAAQVERLGLVSMVHSQEQLQKSRALASQGVELFLWESPALRQGMAGGASANGHRPNPLRRIGKSLYQVARSGLRRPLDTVPQDLQFRNMAQPLQRALAATHWDAVVVVQSQCASWLDYFPAPPVSVLVFHDVRALVCERRDSVSGRAGLRPRLEREIYRRFEREYCRKYDLVITVSRADEEWVRRHYQPKRLVTIPIPVDAGYFRPLAGVEETPNRIVFTGMMDHPPNVDAAVYFAREVLPAVQRSVPDAEFWIVGREPAPAVRALAAVPGVVVTGFVPDIRPHIAQAAVFVVPLRFGAGMRNKILEAWAMEKCVVSTSIGVEGLDASDGENLFLADDALTMARRVVECLSEPALRNRLRTHGREVVRRRHDPDALATAYRSAVEDVVRERRRQARPRRVVVDLRWMRPGVAGGIENLSRSFLRQLADLDRFNRYTVLVPAQVRFDFDLRANPNLRMVAADGPAHQWRRALWKGAQLLHRAGRVDFWRTPEVEALRSARRLDADVVLSMSGYIGTDMYPHRNLLVVHDLQHEYHPEFFPPEVLEERRRVFGDSIRKADRLIAVSEHTRRTVLEKFGIEPERITTVHEAADPIFEPARRAGLSAKAVLEKYRLRERDYLFFPAHTWPHKNHRAALEALAVLRDRFQLRPLLVCTGSPKEAHGSIHETIEALGLKEQVRFLGYTPLQDMPPLYEGAAALVYPSYFEGFGIPLLEAMWCDCPIVCSDRTSLPEVAGDAALLVDPDQSEALAAALRRVLVEPALRQDLVQRGRAQVQRFSWRTFATETVRLLQETAEA